MPNFPSKYMYISYPRSLGQKLKRNIHLFINNNNNNNNSNNNGIYS